MKKTLSFFMLLAFCVTVIFIAGCGGDNKEASNQSTTAQSDNGGTVASLFAKGKVIEGMSYDYTVTSGAETFTGKFWMQGNKIKNEFSAGGQKMVMIFDGNAYYNYMPDENTAIKIASDTSKKIETPLEYTKEVDTQPDKYKIKEAVTYDGMKCKLVVIIAPDGKEQMKMWVSEEYGIPVRVESGGVDGNKTVIEYKNIEINKISADTFKLPGGVEITDMGNVMQQMPPVPQVQGSNQ